MGNRRRPFRFAFPKIRISGEDKGEQLGCDNPLAVEVAGPLFKAGVRIAGITERVDYHTDPDLKTGRAQFHMFTLLLQGHLSLAVGDRMHPMRPGELVYNPPGSPHLRKGKRKGGCWWLFIEVFDLPLWQPLKERGPFVRDYEYADQMFLLLRRTLDIHKTREARCMLLAHANASGLVELLKHELALVGSAPDRRRAALAELVADISKAPEAEWNTSEIAANMGISRATLTRLFLAEYGMPPKALIMKHRMARAAELLGSTGRTIEEISCSLGYKSPFTFSNLFEKHTGLRPGRFRKLSRERDRQ